MNAVLDPSPHLPLIRNIISRMGIRGDLAEECFSESLVTVTEATQKFDPNRNVPYASWLAMNIRWGIGEWLSRQKRTVQLPTVIEAPVEPLSACVALKEALSLADRILTPVERQVLLSGALGYSGKEISNVLGITAVAVSRAKKQAIAKLRKEINEKACRIN